VAPLKKEWTDPLIRRHIQDAVNQQADRVGFITGDVAAKFSGGELSGQRAFYGTADLERLRQQGVDDVRKLINDLDQDIKYIETHGVEEGLSAAAVEKQMLEEMRDALTEWIDAGAPLKGKVAYKAREVLRRD